MVGICMLNTLLQIQKVGQSARGDLRKADIKYLLVFKVNFILFFLCFGYWSFMSTQLENVIVQGCF